MKPKVCLECGHEYTPKRRTKAFCSDKCRKGWNNRRMIRGAEFYDLFMAMRFEREKAKADSLWSILCNLASAAKASDDHKRAGRKSYDATAALARRPLAFSHEGDKR